MKKLKRLPIGSVSEGTHKTEDLLDTFLILANRLVLNQQDRAKVREIHRKFNEMSQMEVPAWKEMEEELAELTVILDDYVPLFCQFGTHGGDGADFGVWVDDTAIRFAEMDEELRRGPMKPKLTKTEYVLRYFLEVNDHGNLTMFRRAGNRWVKEWAVV